MPNQFAGEVSMKFGESLRKERELRHITLEEISQRTRVHPRFLEAIEKDDLSVLPAKAFAKGFLRSYARMVDLDEELVIANFEYCHHAMQQPGQSIAAPPIVEKNASSRRVWPVVFGVMFLILAALLFLFYQGYLQF